MERKLNWWFTVPYLAVALAVIAIAYFAPGLIPGYVLIVLTLSLGALGVVGMLVHAIVRYRAGESPIRAFYSIAAFLVVIGFNHYLEIYVLSRGLLVYLTTSRLETEGIHFKAADDGSFHPRVDINGVIIDFVMNPEAPDIVLTTEDAKRIGIEPSSLRFDGAEQAADVTLSALRIGSLVMNDVPAKILATDKSGNVLGEAFFDRVGDWKIKDGYLMILP